MDKRITLTVAGALVCALALAGCHGRNRAGSAGGAGAPAVSGTATAAQAGGSGGGAGGGVPGVAPTGAAAVDSELGTVDQQLGVAGTDLAQATQSPSDGD
jgi:hypothetical protein